MDPNEILIEQARIKEQLKTLFEHQERQDKLLDTVHEIAASVRMLAQAQAETTKKLEALSADVNDIKNKPAKRWDGVVSVIITAVVTAFITLALTRIGLQ